MNQNSGRIKVNNLGPIIFNNITTAGQSGICDVFLLWKTGQRVRLG